MGTVLWELRGCLASECGMNERSLFIKKLMHTVFTAYAKPVCGIFPLLSFSFILFHLYSFVMTFTIPYFLNV